MSTATAEAPTLDLTPLPTQRAWWLECIESPTHVNRWPEMWGKGPVTYAEAEAQLRWSMSEDAEIPCRNKHRIVSAWDV